MNEFFKFIFNFDIVDKVLRPEWIKLYDYMFIDNTLIANLQKNAELYSELIASVYTKASGQTAIKVAVPKEVVDSEEEQEKVEEVIQRKIITIQEPFNLTKPKPKKFKEPIQIVNQFTIQHKPKSEDYYNKVNLEKLEEQRKDRLNIIKNVNTIFLIIQFLYVEYNKKIRRK